MADRCYVLALPNGEEVETNDGTPHFKTEKDARAAVELAGSRDAEVVARAASDAAWIPQGGAS